MAPKVASSRKATEEPEAKKAKVEESKVEKKEEVKEDDKFQEPDAKTDSRPALKEKIQFHTEDTTLNLVQTLGGKLLTSLNEGGMSCFIAGARANVSQKAGRYMFEVKIVETLDAGQSGKHGRPLLKIGFSPASSSLFQDAGTVAFDSDGTFQADKKKQTVANGRIAKSQVAAVVLNLDSKSPNFNTIALYRDGIAVGSPMPLPDDIKGQPLFPHISFKNCTVAINFGPTAMKELPFKCRMLQSAAASDCSVVPSKEPKNGKYEVVLPVAFPDQGTFDWLDLYLEKNPQYVELSDRKLVQWANASGMYAQGGKGQSNDKPNLNLGISGQDGNSLRRVINSVAPLVPRNYLVMEVKSNLIAAERGALLKKFNYSCYKKIAHVVMGEPNSEFKEVVQKKLLKDKQTKADNAWKLKKADLERKKAADKRKKEAEKAKKEAEKKKAAEKKAKEAAEGAEEKKEDEPMEEDKEEPEEPEEEQPVVELDDGEKQMSFMPKSTPDLTSQVMLSSYSKFTAPEEEEDFDEIRYEWQKGEKAKDYLKTWVAEKKLTTRVDDIKPGPDFKKKTNEFEALLKGWQEKLKAFKSSSKKKGEVDVDLDIFTVSDVNDVGNGSPLFQLFTFEDWELVKLRFQLALLIWSFKKDTNDPDRIGIPLDHLSFYYNKYYSKAMNCKQYGVDDVKDVLAFIKDIVSIKDKLVIGELADDLDNFDIFVKLTEEQRRERARRIEAGDETARLKFTPPAEPKAAPKPAPKPEAKPATSIAGTPAPKAGATPASGKLGATPAPKAAATAGKGGKKGGIVGLK